MPPPPTKPVDESPEPMESGATASAPAGRPKKPWSKPTLLDEAAIERISGGPAPEINEFAAYFIPS